MATNKAALRIVALASMLLPSTAFAHPGHGSTGFEQGFIHPISGLDHTLAMITVGIFAYQLGGRALWLVPAAFVLVMTLGGWLGMTGLDLPFVEIAIALSVIVLSAVVAFDVKMPVAAAMGVVGFFAIFHGHAHGAEIPPAAAGLAYAAGFMLATAILHVAGIGAGLLLGRAGPVIVRSTAALIAITGVALLGAVL